MNKVDEIFALLDENRGEFVSGQMLSKRFGMTRSAVWKYVRLIMDRGVEIEAKTRVGYRIVSREGCVAKKKIEEYLNNQKFKLRVFNSVSSTNDVAKQLARDGAEEWECIIARTQTCGKGRMGRSFESPDESGIYMSIILRPTLPPNESVKITTAAAVAVSRAIEKYTSKKCLIKWVNDIYIDEKKVCGILTEASVNVEDNRTEYAVVGIGINITAENLSDELKSIAGGIYPDDTKDVKNKLIAEVLREFETAYAHIGGSGVYRQYRERSFLIGEEITYFKDGQLCDATVLDVTPNYSLKIKTKDGEEKRLSSGEVSVKKKP